MKISGSFEVFPLSSNSCYASYANSVYGYHINIVRILGLLELVLIFSELIIVAGGKGFEPSPLNLGGNQIHGFEVDQIISEAQSQTKEETLLLRML